MSHIFTTIHVDNGVPVFPFSHARRLKIQSDLPLSEDDIVREIKSESEGCVQMALKVIVENGTVVCEKRPLTVYPKSNYKVEAKVIEIARPERHRLKIFPHPIAHQKKNRDIDEWVWLDSNYRVLEAEWSNVWHESRDGIHTTGLNRPILQGIMRTAIVVTAKQLGISVIEGDTLWNPSACWALSSSLKYMTFTKEPQEDSKLVEIYQEVYNQRFNDDFDRLIRSGLQV